MSVGTVIFVHIYLYFDIIFWFKKMSKFEQVKTVYVSSAVNSSPNCLDWGVNGLVVYGSCNAIHLYDPQITVSLLKQLS